MSTSSASNNPTNSTNTQYQPSPLSTQTPQYQPRKGRYMKREDVEQKQEVIIQKTDTISDEKLQTPRLEERPKLEDLPIMQTISDQTNAKGKEIEKSPSLNTQVSENQSTTNKVTDVAEEVVTPRPKLADFISQNLPMVSITRSLPARHRSDGVGTEGIKNFNEQIYNILIQKLKLSESDSLNLISLVNRNDLMTVNEISEKEKTDLWFEYPLTIDRFMKDAHLSEKEALMICKLQSLIDAAQESASHPEESSLTNIDITKKQWQTLTVELKLKPEEVVHLWKTLTSELKVKPDEAMQVIKFTVAQKQKIDQGDPFAKDIVVIPETNCVFYYVSKDTALVIPSVELHNCVKDNRDCSGLFNALEFNSGFKVGWMIQFKGKTAI